MERPLPGKGNDELTWDDITDAIYYLKAGTPVQARLVMESDGIVANLRPLLITRVGTSDDDDGTVTIDFEIDETDDDEGEEPKAVA